MKFVVMTLFPDMIRQALSYSMLGRALEAGAIEVEVVDIRDFAGNKHNTVDDYPFGGGAGMVIQAPPVYDCYQDVKSRLKNPNAPVLFMSPKGQTFTQRVAERLAQEEEIVILCGHYEGIDQRALDAIVTEEISSGDYVLTGGELPALMVIDCVSRLVDGVLGNADSAADESFSGCLLEYPQYTRPREWNGAEVPEVLLNGNHAEITKWRDRKALEITLKNRPDMIDEEKLTKQQLKILRKIREEEFMADEPEQL